MQLTLTKQNRRSRINETTTSLLHDTGHRWEMDSEVRRTFHVGYTQF
jgi:hypothetical protein